MTIFFSEWEYIKIFDSEIKTMIIVYVFLIVAAFGFIIFLINVFLVRKRNKNIIQEYYAIEQEKENIDNEIYSITKNRKNKGG